MQRGVAWLGDKLRVAAGRSVTYRRGTQTIPLTAVGVRHRRGLMGAENLTTIVTTYEWQIQAAELAFSGTLVEPRPGDQVVESVNGITVKYQVLDLDESTPCFEFLDESGHELIVHTKRMR